MNDWVVVYSNSLAAGVELRKAILEENSIPFIVMDKQCSSYSGIGFASIEIELKVPAEYAEQAIVLMPNE